jgi:hypothetical protein
MRFNLDHKSWLLSALFVLQIGFLHAKEQPDTPTLENLAKHQQWLSLLHLKDGQLRITDPNFILSIEAFNPLKELQKTVDLFNTDNTAICRFPARYQFLNHFLSLETPLSVDDAHCVELKKYEDAVPFDQINLIFASEVLSSASSMMGHSFLNVSGKNLNLTEVSHSVSFFSEFSSFNPFKLIYDGIIGGMNGFFIVRPFANDYQQYLDVEGRNLWSYELKLTDFEKQLIKSHIWELKDVEIEYLFQSYNCATLTLYILGLANPELGREEVLYVSPVDVVKAVDKHKMIKNKKVTLTDDWAFNMLSQEVGNDARKYINAELFLDTKFQFSNLGPHSEALSRKYLSLLIDRPYIKQKLTDTRYAELQDVADKSSKITLDLTKYKDPLKSPQDSSFNTTLTTVNGEAFLDLGFLPAAHHLYSDNRQFFAESELKIAQVRVRTSLDSASSQLQSLVLYSVKSFLPSTNQMPQLSGAFFMGFHHVLDSNLAEKGVFEFSGAAGKTFQVHPDIMLYGMLGGGMGSDIKNTYLFVQPYLGGIINLIGDTKAIFEHRLEVGRFDSSDILQTSALSFAWYGWDDVTLNVSFESVAGNKNRNNILSIGLDYQF